MFSLSFNHSVLIHHRIKMLSSRSVILDNWEWVLTVLIASVTFWIVFIKRKSFKESTKQQTQRINSPSEHLDSDSNEDEVDELTPSLETKDHVPFPGAKITLNGGVDKFYEIVNDRRSVRKFSSRKVDKEIIEKCILCAGTSPSGAHTEPWVFCLVSDSNIKSQIREIIEAEEYFNYQQRMSKQWTTDLKPLKTYHVKEYLTEAPYLILIFKQTYGVRKDGKKKEHYYNEISVAISTGILISALQCAGLNSLITTPLNCGPALRTLLSRPKYEKLLVLIPVGYASDDCCVPDLERKPLEEIIARY